MKYMLLQTTIGDYRQQVMKLLCDELGDSFQAYAGVEYFYPTLRTGVEIGDQLTTIQNHYFLKRNFLWQTGMWKDALKARALIVEANPRILSTWLLIILRKLLRKNTVLWMHAWPRSGRHSSTDKFRHIIRSLGDIILVYTHTQEKELRERMPKKTIMTAPNALYSEKQMCADVTIQPEDFIYVGRLVEEKKPMLLVQAFHKALATDDFKAKLTIFGDGPERVKLQSYIEHHDLGHKIELMGHEADLLILRKYYNSSVASVSPGYVGLSITQSISFGVPMIISNNENHAPEIEAAEADFNCEFFKTDSLDSLCDTLIRFYHNRNCWLSKREAIVNDCKGKYSIDLMAKNIINAFTFTK